MRIAVLGAARIAGKALIEPAREHEGVEVRAIGASTQLRAREFAAAHAIPVAGTYTEVIARDDIDLVYIALPPSAHAHWTVEAARAGKHVLVEKPSATTAGEARAMVEAAQDAGVRLIEAFHYAWHPLYLRAQELVQGGALGALTGIEAAFSVPIQRNPDEFRWRPELGGGALADLGCYPVHWVRGLLTYEPEVLAAQQEMEAGVDLATSAQLAGPGSEDETGRVPVPCTIACHMDPPQRDISLTVRGTGGVLRIDNPLAPQFGHRFELTDSSGQVRTERFALRPTFAFQFDGVIEALRSGAPVRCEGADIVANMAVMDQIRALGAGQRPAP
jgi:predicted dehydrogenase